MKFLFEIGLYLALIPAAYAVDTDVKVKLINKTTHPINFAVDNFKYDDDNRYWQVLPEESSDIVGITYTTKYGYFELKIKNANDQVVYSYVPTGLNHEVTVIIENGSHPLGLIIRREIGIWQY